MYQVDDFFTFRSVNIITYEFLVQSFVSMPTQYETVLLLHYLQGNIIHTYDSSCSK